MIERALSINEQIETNQSMSVRLRYFGTHVQEMYQVSTLEERMSNFE